VTNTNTYGLAVNTGPLAELGGVGFTASYTVGSQNTSGTVNTSGVTMTVTRQSQAPVTLTAKQAMSQR
jgi:hypothetical protein